MVSKGDRHLQAFGDGLDCPDVFRHVFAGNPVAPGSGGDKTALTVRDGNGQSVHLQFGQQLRRSQARFVQALQKGGDIRFVKSIFQGK